MTEVKLLGKEALADKTIGFRLEKPNSFDFEAGQHIEVKLPENEDTKADEKSRIFSMASAPHENFLMLATRMTGSPFKEAFARTKNGTLLEINGPWGDLVLHEDNSLPAIFLIGGIGITAARSIIRDSLKRETGHKLYLFYSNRTPDDTAFRSDLIESAKEDENFEFIETMTDVDDWDGDWDGETGYIDEEMVKKYLENPEEAVYYMSGPPKMVKAMKKVAKGLGADDLHIKSEEYAGY